MTNYQKARDWMHFASLDLRTALATFRVNDFSACIQHCQQSLERAITSLLSQRIVEKIEVEKNLHTLVRAVWMTPEDLEGHVKAKAGYVLDAFDEGILLYDQDGFLSESRKKLVEELREKGVVKTDRWWSFPVKAGEEYTY